MTVFSNNGRAPKAISDMDDNEAGKLPDKNVVMLPPSLIDDRGDEIDITYEAPTVPDRGSWGGKLDFFMTCVGYAVGLGNVWRFPYLCYKNGGGAFLIPYTLMLLLLGLPLFFLEFAFGQFASLGPISVWNISPLFKGIGYAMVLVSWILVIYYQVVVAQCIYFLISSFTSVLPWTDCGHEWNSPGCVDGTNATLNATTYFGKVTSPSEDYYYRHVLEISSGIEEFGTPSWKLTLCLFASWVVCCLVVIKGVQSLGKVSYFTAVFPYILLTILLIRSLLLPGAFQGIVFYLKPEFSRLLDPRVWVDAATQIFFSLSCCNGGLIAISSFNKFKNNCCRDAVIVAFINCATSVYAGFVIFANLGFMANAKNTTVDAVAKSGPGLAFVVYPEALTKMPMPSIWAVFFFFMMCTLGFGSQFSILEAIISGLQDELRRFGYVQTNAKQIIFRCIVCLINFLLGIPLLCGGGYYLFYLIDNYLSGYPLLFIAIAETVVICYIYGLRQFRRDIELMINERPNWYWRICWMFVVPALSFALLVFLFAAGEEFSVEEYRYPPWALGLGNLIASSPVLMMPLWFFYKYCREGGFILLREFFKPVHEWGPARDEHRAEFISMIRSNESLKRSRLNNASSSILPAVATMNTGSQLQVGYGLGGSVISGLAGTGIIDDTGFFQSKLSVAEKLTHAHTKEVMKRVTSTAEMGSTDALGFLTASQTALATAAASSAAQYGLNLGSQPSPLHENVDADGESDEAMENKPAATFTLPGNGDAQSILLDSTSKQGEPQTKNADQSVQITRS
uniref:Transporter n=1 Tax=Cryptocotyle lingua TaxID=66766 RepID=A0A7U0YEZ0_9TREM|nr:glycine transporter [Cryptocotyle lingua]